MTQNGAQITKFSQRIIVYIAISLLMSNLNALVDMFQHPEIPYFDEEHLLVGGITVLVTVVLFGILEKYLICLDKATSKIKTLEKFLAICANCKKIKIPGADPEKKESWQQIESYIGKKTSTEFSHGICPECGLKLYPELIQDSILNAKSTQQGN